MLSMSYCRFRNIESELSLCVQALESNEIPEGPEASAAFRMFRDTLQCMKDNGVIRDYSEEYLKDVIEQSTAPAEEEE